MDSIPPFFNTKNALNVSSVTRKVIQQFLYICCILWALDLTMGVNLFH